MSHLSTARLCHCHCGRAQLFLCAYLQHGGIFSQAEVLTTLPAFALFIELVAFVPMPLPFFWARTASVSSTSVVEFTTQFHSYLLQGFYEFPVLDLERLQLSRYVPQPFILFSDGVLLGIGELVETQGPGLPGR